MQVSSRSFYLLATSLLALSCAQTANAQSNSGVEAIVVTGVRGEPRTVLDTPVPVDVISPATIQSTPFSDVNNVLNSVIPSFTVARQANTTSGTFIRPISIRGLPEDEVLLLLNGKRRHLSASVAVSGTGAQGPDAAVIPVLALQNIQVLRDGAAAQYGSDAIAGVINFVLKDADHGFTVDANAGQTSEGDGQSATIAANFGMPIPFLNKGFVNVTGEYDRQGRTIRVGNYVSTPFTCSTYAAANPIFAAMIHGNCRLQRTGQPSTEAFRSIVNAGLPVTDNSEFYYFGNFSISRGDAYGSYRYPANGQQVNGPTVRLQNGNTFSFTNVFPAGWNPIFSGLVKDWSSTAGYKGHVDFDGGRTFTYDFSGRYGWDQIAYLVSHTVNPSLGPTTPYNFHPYTDRNSEAAVNADFTYTLPTNWFAKPLVLSSGAEYRRITYRIVGGSPVDGTYNGVPNSIAAGPYANPDPWGFCNAGVPTAAGAALPASAGLNCANPKDPTFQTLPAGSNSITGLPPQSTGIWSDHVRGIYGEASTDVVEGWNVDAAVRFEDYDSYGSNWSEKFATRLQLNDWLAVRGSIGTGFHAPSPGMLHQTNIQLKTVNGNPQQSGLFPPDSVVAQFLGAKPMRPEKAVNYSAGVVATPFDGATLTVDTYMIRMIDQIYTSRDITVTPSILAKMEAAGVPGANSIVSVSFFQNSFNSKTYGIDVVGTYDYPWDSTLWGYDQSTHFNVSMNLNRYVITLVKVGGLFSPQQVFNFEHNNPEWRSVLTLTHDVGPFEAMIRANIYGPFSVATTAAPYLFQNVAPDANFDVEGSWQMSDNYRFSIGALNVFNKYPQVNTINAQRGLMYYDGPQSWQGSYYYIRLRYTL